MPVFEKIKEFAEFLITTEKSRNTREKYLRDVEGFVGFVGEWEIDREITNAYKDHIIETGYAVRSVNSMIASVNSFLRFIGREDCKIKSVKLQKQVFCAEEKELTRAEYERLLETADKRGDKKLSLILKTIFGTGIRVSELSFITVEAVKKREAIVSCKGKTRKVFIISNLRRLLKDYAKENKIKRGSIFLNHAGKPVDRTSVWRAMKKLCADAKVNPTKVFPHNLRHLFARVFYKMEKDIVMLADLLGHSSINTTKIYLISTGAEHRRRMERLHLVE